MSEKEVWERSKVTIYLFTKILILIKTRWDFNIHMSSNHQKLVRVDYSVLVEDGQSNTIWVDYSV